MENGWKIDPRLERPQKAPKRAQNADPNVAPGHNFLLFSLKINPDILYFPYTSIHGNHCRTVPGT